MNEKVPGTDIRILQDIERGRFKYALFDFDGTVSLLREGWQAIMTPVCLDAIRGNSPVTPELEAAVHEMIEETTGIQTIIQMERLVEMVREFGFVPESDVLDAHGYKALYNERLLVPVRERIARIQNGQDPIQNWIVNGSIDFLKRLKARGLEMYIFSGTDRDDVVNEANVLGVAPYFNEIWGALRTVEEYSKEQVLRDLIAQHDLHGAEVLVCGDGPVEIRNGKQFGCVTIGICSDEKTGQGWDEAKIPRLTKAGADLMICDFAEAAALEGYLFP